MTCTREIVEGEHNADFDATANANTTIEQTISTPRRSQKLQRCTTRIGFNGVPFWRINASDHVRSTTEELDERLVEHYLRLLSPRPLCEEPTQEFTESDSGPVSIAGEVQFPSKSDPIPIPRGARLGPEGTLIAIAGCSVIFG
jgi:hypothetical protein